MRYLILPLAAMVLAACGVRDAVPEEADRTLLWIIGLSAAFFLLSAGGFMLSGMGRRWGRREDRWARRGWTDEPKDKAG